MPKGFFITGTDTGVGKTVIAAALIKAVHMLGLRACGMKPIETGCLKQGFEVQSSTFNVQRSEFEDQNESLIPADGMFLRTIAGTEESIDLITPVRFENPLAPLPASEIEGMPVDIEKIREAFSFLSRNYDAVVVEGIGGLLVPIGGDYFVLDLARDFGLPLIVVSKPGLGTINHTMLTVNCALKEGLIVAGIIVNYSHTPEGNIAENTNPEVIKRISPAPLIGVFPYLPDLESATIEKAVAKNLDLEIIKKYL